MLIPLLCRLTMPGLALSLATMLDQARKIIRSQHRWRKFVNGSISGQADVLLEL